MRGTLRILSTRLSSLPPRSFYPSATVRQPYFNLINRSLSTAQPVEKPDRSTSGKSSDETIANEKKDATTTTPSTEQTTIETKKSDSQAEKKDTTEQKQTIPDINSTSLGIEDPHTNDPYKWQKFAWKYAGAVLLFFISYKTLHWYVDRLQADGKRKREEVEENKEISKELYASESPGLASGVSQQPAPAMGVFQSTQAPMQQDSTIPPPIQQPSDAEAALSQIMPEYIPQTTSELDELYAYQKEIQTQLKDLQQRSGSRENVDQKLSLKTELEELAAEIAQLEAK